MNPIQALKNSFARLGRLWQMVVLYWFLQTLAAALVALPLAGTAIPSLAHSRYTADLLKQFDLMWVMELMFATKGLPALIIAPVAVCAVLLALLSAVWLAGGAVRMLTQRGPYTIAAFHQGAGLYFYRYLRLALISLLFYAIACVPGGIVSAVANKLWGEGMEAAPLAIAGWVKSGLQIVLCGLVATAMDYAKVRLAVDGSRSSFLAALGSLRLVLANLGTTMGVWLVLLVVSAAAVAVYLPVANALPGTAMGPILLLFFWQQVYVLVRVTLRLASWGAAAELDPYLRPPVPEPPPAPAFEQVPVAAGPPEVEAGAEAPIGEEVADEAPKDTTE